MQVTSISVQSFDLRPSSSRQASPAPKTADNDSATQACDIKLVGIETLRPTQMAVGMRSVTHKRSKLDGVIGRRKQIEKLLSKRPIPVVRGPGRELFVIDHHHFGLALWQAQIDKAYIRVVDDLAHIPQAAFWRRMEAAGRLYPFDENGQRVEPWSLPPWLHSLRHDVYRDLAWEVREAGGFRKVATPYAEFRWADFLRDRISLPAIRRDYEAARASALRLCRTKAAAGLPGFAGAKA